MRHSIRFAPEAQRDLDRIWQFYAAHGVDVADRILARLGSATRRLMDYPYSAPALAKRDRTLRRLAAHGHVILYRVSDDELLLLRVFDARQNWSDLTDISDR